MIPAAVCALASAASLSLGSISEMPRMNTIDYFDWKLQLTERNLDGTIACDIDRTHDVEKNAYERMTESQKRVADEKAAYNKKRARAWSKSHCSNSPRVLAANGVSECNLEGRMR